MVTKYVEFSVICDKCGLDMCASSLHQWFNSDLKYYGKTVIPSTVGKRDARKIAKGFNWSFARGQDICPFCNGAYKKITSDNSTIGDA